jgi:hypothetical protein
VRKAIARLGSTGEHEGDIVEAQSKEEAGHEGEMKAVAASLLRERDRARQVTKRLE